MGMVENGDSITWNTLHFAPVEMHEIEMTIHEAQDDLNIETASKRYSNNDLNAFY